MTVAYQSFFMCVGGGIEEDLTAEGEKDLGGYLQNKTG
jgi:hypothetical protein